MSWRDDILQWARAAEKTDAIPLSKVESRVRVAAGDLERGNWVLSLLEGIAWLAAIAAPATFMANQPEFGRIVPIENALAFTIAGTCFAVAMLAPVLSIVRWLRRGRRRSGATIWSSGFVLICVAVGLAFMFIRAQVSSGEPGVWPAVGVVAAVLCVASLAVQAAGSRTSASGASEQLEAEMLDARNQALQVLLERGLIGVELHRQAVAKPFRKLVELGSASQMEQEQ